MSKKTKLPRHKLPRWQRRKNNSLPRGKLSKLPQTVAWPK